MLSIVNDSYYRTLLHNILSCKSTYHAWNLGKKRNRKTGYCSNETRVFVYYSTGVHMYNCMWCLRNFSCAFTLNERDWMTMWLNFFLVFFFFFGFFFFSFCFLLLFFVLFLERSCTFAKQSWTFKQLNLWTCTMQITIIVLHYNETRFCADFVI